MRPWRALLAIVLLLVCAALWMMLMPDKAERSWAPACGRAMDSFALADRALQRDLLMARAGLLRNYDPMTADVEEMETSLASLARLATKDPVLARSVRHLTEDSANRIALSEQFKSDNALLQNSLARLAHVSASPQASKAASLLSANILRLTLDTTPNAVANAEQGLSAYERSAGFAPDGETRQLYNHARLLVRILPAVDRIVADIQALPIDRDLAQVRIAAAAVSQRIADRTQRHKIILITVSSLTAAIILALVIALHFHVQSLRRRGDFEHLHATILGLMIDVRSQELPGRIKRALERVADHVGADRAYLLLGDGRATTYLWSRHNSFTPPYARAVIEATTSHLPWTGDSIQLPVVSSLPSDQRRSIERYGPLPASLILLRSPESEGAVVLGIESDRGPLRLRPETLAGLGAALVAILQAVHRDRLEAERLEFERKFARGRRMETIGSFASGIAHNVNNIIGAIAGFAETAELHVAKGSAASRNLAEIRSAVGRARMLVDQVLRFGRRAEHPHEPVPLAPFIEETTRLLGASLPSGVALKLGPPIPAITLDADAVQLQQVLLNLCHNAAVAMPDGGTIRCDIEHFRIRDPRRLSHAVIRPADYVVISISDEGHGISTATLPRLFDPFFTTRQGGTGLGLSTAWEIIQQHGGSIDAQSEAGQGSCFSVWLPVPESESSTVARVPHRGAGQTILLVNPDAKALERDEELVAALGYEPWGVTTIEAAIEAVEACDCILVASPDPSFASRAAGQLRSVAGGRACLVASPLLQEDAEELHYPLRTYDLVLALAAAQKEAEPVHQPV